MPFIPGLGVGGHCIPVDPLYFEYNFKNENQNYELINAANVAERRALMEENKNLKEKMRLLNEANKVSSLY